MGEYGWRPTHASRALLEKPAAERFDRFVKRVGPNREQGAVFLEQEEDAEDGDDVSETCSVDSAEIQASVD